MKLLFYFKWAVKRKGYRVNKNYTRNRSKWKENAVKNVCSRFAAPLFDLLAVLHRFHVAIHVFPSRPPTTSNALHGWFQCIWYISEKIYRAMHREEGCILRILREKTTWIKFDKEWRNLPLKKVYVHLIQNDWPPWWEKKTDKELRFNIWSKRFPPWRLSRNDLARAGGNSIRSWKSTENLVYFLNGRLVGIRPNAVVSKLNLESPDYRNIRKSFFFPSKEYRRKEFLIIIRDIHISNYKY